MVGNGSATALISPGVLPRLRCPHTYIAPGNRRMALCSWPPNCCRFGIYYVDVGDVITADGPNALVDSRSGARGYTDAGTRYLEAFGRVDLESMNEMLILLLSHLYHAAAPDMGGVTASWWRSTQRFSTSLPANQMPTVFYRKAER